MKFHTEGGGEARIFLEGYDLERRLFKTNPNVAF
jgi:hypothetical protein